MATFPGILQKLEQDEAADEIDTKKERFYEKTECPECHGKRLKSEALCFRIAGKDISELCQMDIENLYGWFCTINEHLTERQKSISADVIKEIKDRLGFLLDVGLSYLSLNRSSRTLSGGESQRIRLATQIGSKLVNVLYILDEPSIGLHQRDNTKLINALKQLRDEGNTIIVVEHDAETMLNADYLIDLGPEAGRKGGELLFAGDIKTFLKSKIDSFTHDYLTGVKQIEIPSVRRKGNGLTIDIEGATGNNLKDINVSLPLGTLTCITGVSGSGKSSLINGTLVPFITRRLYHSVAELLPVRAINGLENIDKIVTIDQSPIGRSPRSNPATYTGVFSDIRKLFGETPDAKIRGFKAGHFSFNVSGGRCEECKGCGVKLIEMNFLPDVYVPCPSCNKLRYKSDTLEVHYKGKNINDVLEMTVNQAVEFFSNIPSIAQKMETLQRVGLGYIKLGQASTTLSGGESQRLKLAGELYKHDTGNTLYVLDEPTTGLHIEDIRVLMGILQALVDKGNTVLVIEHNLDVIKCADYIIDMGKEGGAAGGNILFAGTPEELASFTDSYTGQYLKNIL